jgi:hypothetical protein
MRRPPGPEVAGPAGATPADPSADPLVFVGGAQRSGTTLLRNMLTAHPLLAIPDESPFMHSVHRLLLRRGAADDAHLAWALIRQTPRFRQWRLPREHVERALERTSPSSYAELLRVLFAAYAEFRGKPHAGDKTTANALHFTWLGAMFPGSKFVHLLRDPREVCMSLAVQPFNVGGLTGAARHWRAHVAAARAARAQLGPRLLELRYEELIRRPREQLELLCSFLGLPFDSRMLRAHESAEALPAHRFDALSRSPVQPGVRDWRRELSADEVSLIEFVAGPLMDRVGYPRELGRLRARAAAQLFRERAAQARERWLEQGAPVLGRLLGADRSRRPVGPR